MGKKKVELNLSQKAEWEDFEKLGNHLHALNSNNLESFLFTGWKIS